MRLELEATPAAVMRAVEALQAFGEARHVPAGEVFGLALALEECGSNIVNHALGRDRTAHFHVGFEADRHELTVELRDGGPAFDPTLAPAVAPATAEDHDRPPGGWGIALARRHVDAMHYSRCAGENILRLTKRLADPPKPS